MCCRVLMIEYIKRLTCVAVFNDRIHGTTNMCCCVNDRIQGTTNMCCRVLMIEYMERLTCVAVF